MPVAWVDPPAPPPLEPDEPPRIADGRVFVQLALAHADDLWGRATWGASRWGAISASNIIDATCDVEGLTIERGREDPLGPFSPSRMTASLIDPDRRWSPAAVDPSGIRPMRAGVPIRAVAMAPDTEPVTLFAGTVTQLRELDDGTEPPIVALEALGSLGSLAGDRVVPPAGGDGELPKARLERLLARSSHRLPWWSVDLDTGTTPLQPFEDPGDGEPDAMLDYAQLVADSDGGALIELADGTVTYRTVEALDARLPAWHLTDEHPPPPAVAEAAYLDPTVGTASMPDAGEWPAEYHWTAKVLLPRTLVADFLIGSEWPSMQAWAWTSGWDEWSRGYMWCRAGTTADYQGGGATLAQQTAGGLEAGTAVTLRTTLRVGGAWSYELELSHDDGTTWSLLGVAEPATTGPPAPRSTLVLADGGAWWAGGRLYSFEARAGTPAAPGEVLWRFDAGEVPEGATTYTDPRGRVWTLTDPAAITPAVVPEPDERSWVCATSMSYSLDRERVVNAVGVRAAGDPEPPMWWAEDVGSQSWLGRRPATVEGLLYKTAAVGQRLAGVLLERARRSDLMVSPVVGDVLEEPGWYRLALELELADVVTLSRDDGKGQRLEVTTAQIQAIRHDVTRGVWACQLALGGALEMRLYFDRWSHSARWGSARWV